ncbi:MAG TPA: hypothetical protein DDZ83_13300 [Nitrospinae bacterium]|nr:hypothetical protein [Nitrospinota bacterium]
MSPMKNIPVADGVVLIVLGAYFLRSFFRGALKEVISLVAVLSAYLSTSRLAPTVENALGVWLGSEWMAKAGSRTVVFVLVWVGVSLAGRLLLHLLGKSSIGLFNRFAGGVIGVGKGVFVLAVIYAAVSSFAPNWIPEEREGNRALPYISRAGNFVQRAYALDLNGQAELVKNAIGSALRRSREALPGAPKTP